MSKATTNKVHLARGTLELAQPEVDERLLAPRLEAEHDAEPRVMVTPEDKVFELRRCISSLKQRGISDPQKLVAEVTPVLARTGRTFEINKVFESTISKGLYARYLMSQPEDDFQIVLAMWPPGSSSPIHSHDDVTGAVTCCLGAPLENKYRIITEGAEGHSRLERVSSIELGVGEVTPIFPDEDHQLHDMVNPRQTWAATLHVYFRPFKNYNLYIPDTKVPTQGNRRRSSRTDTIRIPTQLWFDTQPPPQPDIAQEEPAQERLGQGRATCAAPDAADRRR